VGLDVSGVERSAVPIDQAGLIGCRLHDLEQALPRAVARPAYETVIVGLPSPVVGWNVAPGRTRPQTPHDPIDHMPMLNISMTVVWDARQMGRQLPPLLFS
jgi:hypothetical protein